MGIVTLLFVGAEIHADANTVLQHALVGQCFTGRSPLLDMKEAHLKALIRELFSRLFLPLLLFAVWLTLPFTVTTCLLNGGCFFCFVTCWCKTNPPPIVSVKKLLAKAETSLGIELSSTCSCILLKNLDASLTTVETFLISNVLSPISILFVLMGFCENNARCWKNWWTFAMKTIGKCVMLSELSRNHFFCFFILKKPNHFPSKLVEQGFARRNVHHCQLHATDICARHGDVLDRVDAPYSLNHWRDFAPVFLNNSPINFVALLVHLDSCFHDKLPVVLQSILEWINGGWLVDQSSFKVQALKARVEMALGELQREDDKWHQPV